MWWQDMVKDGLEAKGVATETWPSQLEMWCCYAGIWEHPKSGRVCRERSWIWFWIFWVWVVFDKKIVEMLSSQMAKKISLTLPIVYFLIAIPQILKFIPSFLFLLHSSDLTFSWSLRPVNSTLYICLK